MFVQNQGFFLVSVVWIWKKGAPLCSMKLIENLQQKWKVSGSQFWLIMLTFALGGSLSGRLCSFLLKMVFLEKNWTFWLIYPLFLTILWPFSVIFVSLFTGQFRFFKGYLSRVGAKVFGFGGSVAAPSTASAAPIHIALFASGAGTNAQKIIEYFESDEQGLIQVSLIVCNVPNAGVLSIAKQKGIPTLLINKEEFEKSGYVKSLHNADIQFIVLAGFLWKVPEVLVKAYQPGMKIDGTEINGKENITKGIVNIHPALLPKYGGKGMYGERVHQAVMANGEKESGITIHWVNEHYDEGAIIFQAKCTIEQSDTAASIAHKIHALEHANFAPVIAGLLGS